MPVDAIALDAAGDDAAHEADVEQQRDDAYRNPSRVVVCNNFKVCRCCCIAHFFPALSLESVWCDRYNGCGGRLQSEAFNLIFAFVLHCGCDRPDDIVADEHNAEGDGEDGRIGHVG